MCHYCGCRQMPLIRDYIAEHERVTDLGGDAVRAIDRGDLDTARRCLADMAAELASHWQGEENGLFQVMQRDELYAEYIAPLVDEHRELAALLAEVDVTDPVDQMRIRVAVIELHEHISKEEDGLFPASLTALSGEEWDAAMQAWTNAHPGQRMIPE
ncbi:MAG: hemerythrin domain-containing protein [Nocardioidaceae bacterium]